MKVRKNPRMEGNPGMKGKSWNGGDTLDWRGNPRI